MSGKCRRGKKKGRERDWDEAINGGGREREQVYVYMYVREGDRVCKRERTGGGGRERSA